MKITKRIFSITLILMMAFSHAAYSGEDPCPCCPECIQEECDCEECADSDDCKCSVPGGEADWTISFENAMASSPNKNLPDYFVENYTLNFTAAKQGGYTMLGEYMCEGYLMNEMDPSGAYEASGGRLLYDEMGWEGPLGDTSFELSIPEDTALPVDDDGIELSALSGLYGASEKGSISWSVDARHYAETTEGSGSREFEGLATELTYHIVVYKDGKAELYLYTPTASNTLYFQGTVSSKPIGSK